MALTATATPQVEKDVKNILGINNCKRIAPVSLNRPNLYYEVRSKGRDVKTAIAEYIVSKHRNECGVVYCSSREKCEEYAKFFRERYHLLAKHFHAQVDAVSKRETQDKWSAGECHIIVATVRRLVSWSSKRLIRVSLKIAFGMGIDKADGLCHVVWFHSTSLLMVLSSSIRYTLNTARSTGQVRR